MASNSVDLRAEWEARRGHFADDAQLAGNGFHRKLWLTLGVVALGLGILGIVLPIMPTAPFAVLAAAAFARSSPRFYNRVLSNRHFGPVIYQWRERRTIPRRAKVLGLVMILVTFATSIVFFVPNVVPKVIMGVIGLGAFAWLTTVPSTTPRPGSD